MVPAELASANEVLFKAFHLSSDAIAVTRVDDGRIVDANEAFLRLIGFERDEVIGRTTLDLGMWADPADRDRLVRLLSHGGATGSNRIRLRHRSGDDRIVEMSAHVVDVGGVPCILAIDRDVTERERQQEALRAQAAEHRRIVETLQEGLWMIDANDATTFVNAPMAAMLGWEPADMIGRTVFDFMDDEGRRLAQEYLQRRRQGIAEEHDFRFVRRDGSELWAMMNTAPLFDESGAYVGALAAVTDVTERRRQEAALRHSEERFRALATFAPVGIFLANAAGEVAFENNRLREMKGRAEGDEELARGWIDAIHPDDLNDVYNRWFTCTRDGEPFAMEYRYLRPDGAVLRVYSSAIPVRGEDEAITGYLGTVVDITQRAEAEETLREAFDHEREVARELRALDEMKNTLLEAVSHDIRTPLTTVLGIALTLQRADLSLSVQETGDLLRRLAANAQKLERLVSDLLDLDRIRRGLTSADRRPTDVGALVRRLVQDLDLPVDREVHVDAPLVQAEVDGPKVERIVENLVINALRHTASGTPIWVRVEPAGAGVLLAVEDAGRGVPARLRDAIFEPFRQVSSGPKQVPGVGIGLALVARFAALHGGRAWVEDRDGGGSSFRVLLPNAAPAAEPTPRASGRIVAGADASEHGAVAGLPEVRTGDAA